MDKVAIVGAEVYKASEGYIDEYYTDLVARTVISLLERISMPWDELESVVAASADFQDGRSISNVFSMESMGAFMKEDTKVAEDMANAVMYACMRIMSGKFKNCLVCGYGKGSEIRHPYYFTGMQSEPLFMRPLGLDGLSVAALQAQAYMERYGVTQEQAAAMAALDLRNGLKNPTAHRGMDVSPEEVLSSKELAFPIKELEFVPVSDGCVALMLTSADEAGKYTDAPVWIEGIGNCVDLYYPGHRDLSDMRCVREAAQRAYGMAGIAAADVDLVEVYGLSSWQELMVLEGLGFAEPGAAGKKAAEGGFDPDGEIPVNTSGGALAAHVWMACGGARVAECVAQLQGEAGDRQIDGVKRAVAHATNGLGLQSNTVIVLGR